MSQCAFCTTSASNALTFLQVLDVAARERDADLVGFGGGDGGAGRVVLLFTLGDVTHPGSCWRVRW